MVWSFERFESVRRLDVESTRVVFLASDLGQHERDRLERIAEGCLHSMGFGRSNMKLYINNSFTVFDGGSFTFVYGAEPYVTMGRKYLERALEADFTATLLYELGHAQQHAEGKIASCAGGFTWMGSPADASLGLKQEIYVRLPWETDAWRRAMRNPLFPDVGKIKDPLNALSCRVGIMNATSFEEHLSFPWEIDAWMRAVRSPSFPDASLLRDRRIAMAVNEARSRVYGR